jgi:hypothetical protein
MSARLFERNKWPLTSNVFTPTYLGARIRMRYTQAPFCHPWRYGYAVCRHAF